jgi:hypothetical protein
MYQAAPEAECLTSTVRQADEEFQVSSILLEETNQTQKFSHEEQIFTLTDSNEDAANIALAGETVKRFACHSFGRGIGRNGTIKGHKPERVPRMAACIKPAHWRRPDTPRLQLMIGPLSVRRFFGHDRRPFAWQHHVGLSWGDGRRSIPSQPSAR